MQLLDACLFLSYVVMVTLGGATYILFRKATPFSRKLCFAIGILTVIVLKSNAFEVRNGPMASMVDFRFLNSRVCVYQGIGVYYEIFGPDVHHHWILGSRGSGEAHKKDLSWQVVSPSIPGLIRRMGR